MCHKFDEKENAKKAKAMLENLAGRVPTLLTMEVGIDFLGSERSYDLVLIATFNSREALIEYDGHPEHLLVREFIKSHKLASVAVDYEF